MDVPLSDAGCTGRADCAAVLKLDANGCKVATCKAGTCVAEAKADDAACDDGDLCTQNDACKAGSCSPGKVKDCDDGKECTVDSCDKTGKCTNEPKAGNCDDGDACTVEDQCLGPDCAPGQPMACDDTNPCTDDSCDKAKGCVHLPNKATCTDGNKCTQDGCAGGKCVSDDGSEACKCNKDADCLSLDDGNPCNGTLICANTGTAVLPQACTVDMKTIVACDDKDDSTCQQNLCDPKTGKCAPNAVNGGKACDDGDACSTGDACAGTSCKGGAPKKCDDGNPCTADSCDAKTGCAYKGGPNDGVACDDGDACTGSGSKDACKGGKCAPGGPVACTQDGNPCTLAVCDKAKGCGPSPVKDGSACEDGSKCTAKDSCAGGKCVSGEAVKCPGGGACVVVVCNDVKGCTQTPAKDGAPCKKGGVDGACNASVCVVGSIAEDLDHDGLAGAADPCPTVWNPDADKVRGSSSCAKWDASGAHKAWSKSQAVALGEPGQKAGMSKLRRTNEPVELPLVNGILDNSVVAYWKLDGDLTDSTGNSKPDKHSGAAGYGASGLSSGQAFVHPATGSFCFVNPEADNLAVATVSLWFRWPAGKIIPGNRVQLFDKDNNPAAKPGEFEISLHNSGKLMLDLETSDNNNGMNEAKLNDGAWHHVAVVLNDSGVRLHVDGRSAPIVKANKPFIGGVKTALQGNARSICLGSAAGASPLGGGSLDDVIVFNRALSAGEIATYAASKAPYGSSFAPGAQADFDDVRVTEKTDAQVAEHETHFELLGARPHSDSDLAGVVAYWKLDGNGKEAAGKYDATPKGTKQARGRFGDDAGALRLDGAAVLQPKYKPSFDSSGAFTIEAWMLLDKTNWSSRAIFGQSAGIGIFGGYLTFGISGSNKLYGLIGTEAGVNTIGSSALVPHERWTHVAMAYNAGKIFFYIDGLPAGESDFNFKGKIAPGYAAFIGAEGNKSLPKNHFKGVLDELLIHSVARSADYMARRARGLPRVRLLAHTRAKVDKGGGFKLHDYTLRWGNKAAKVVATKVVGLDKKKVCDGLLSPCLGYSG